MHGFLLLSCQIAPIKPIFMAVDKTNGLSNVNNLFNNATFNPMLSSGLREFLSIAWTKKPPFSNDFITLDTIACPSLFFLHDFSFKFLFFHG
ncbi:hypothetical protein [Helicobacter pylori]|uniref:hypothetical protein n=1 Tax=Helicobacter pylori TaxID=210 RepID=UPI0013E29E19|nr:hypothetical protein [Helicobacter pylori]